MCGEVQVNVKEGTRAKTTSNFSEEHDVGFEVDTLRHISQNSTFPPSQFTMPLDLRVVILTNNIISLWH
jgi:hypothetical protein